MACITGNIIALRQEEQQQETHKNEVIVIGITKMILQIKVVIVILGIIVILAIIAIILYEEQR